MRLCIVRPKEIKVTDKVLKAPNLSTVPTVESQVMKVNCFKLARRAEENKDGYDNLELELQMLRLI